MPRTHGRAETAATFIWLSRMAQRAYNQAMSFPEPEALERNPAAKRIVWAAMASALALALAAGLLWLRYGEVIFVDMLSVVQSCF